MFCSPLIPVEYAMMIQPLHAAGALKILLTTGLTGGHRGMPQPSSSHFECHDWCLSTHLFYWTREPLFEVPRMDWQRRQSAIWYTGKLHEKCAAWLAVSGSF